MAPISPANTGPSEFEELLDRFEEAWQGGAAPSIEQFLSRSQQGDASARRRLLVELIKIDLDNRWRRSNRGKGPGQSVPDRLHLKDYVQRFAVLGPLDQLPVELIAEEYWVRQCWGDRPKQEEYLARWPRLAGQLREALARMDAELLVREPGADGGASLQLARKTPGQGGNVQKLDSVDAFLDVLRQYQLIGASQLNEISQTRHSQPRALASELLKRGWLTPYQVNQLFLGRAQDLMLGPYVVLERLGEGGAGQVFKARHQKMNRVVALKLIRKELLTDAEVVARFYREIQVVSQLDHPNVVHAYDAGPVSSGEGGARGHFLAMEYVEGNDLGKQVKQGGPLPVMQACEYIRQAALGLQHAHERGLVHRDIKPHNLIMSLREGLIKVADLGLARLQTAVNLEATAALSGVKGTGTLTPENAVMMGTADYMAPEQALDFHKADIRADIYSLGCTFYYLLTRQPPFPGATMAEKLVKHQVAAPPPVKQFRPDVLPRVSAVLAKMLAKRPEERFQTPAEVAAALAPFGSVRPQVSQATSAPASVRTATKHWWRSLLKRWRLAAAVGGMLTLAGLVLLLVQPLTPAASLQKLRTVSMNPKVNLDRLRQDILQFRMKYFGTPEALQAAELLRKLPSPLEHLDPAKIPVEVGFPNQPKELVAILEPPGPEQFRIVSMAFSPDGTMLACNGQDNNVWLWRLSGDQPKKKQQLKGHKDAVSTVGFAPDGKALASGSNDKTVRLWDLTSAEPKERDSPRVHEYAIGALAFAPDGKTLAGADYGGIVRLWDVAHLAEPIVFRAHGKAVNAVAFAPDGKLLATGDVDSVRLWKLTADKPQPWASPLKGGGYPILAFASDGRVLAELSNGDTVSLWDTASPVAQKRHTLRYGNAFTSLAFAPDGKMVATSDSASQIILWELDSGTNIKWQLPQLPGQIPSSLAFAPDGRHLAVARGYVYIFRFRSASDPQR